MEGLDTGDEDAQRVERRWLKPIYTAAPTVIYRCAVALRGHTACKSQCSQEHP